MADDAEPKLRRNRARCNACGTVVESTNPWEATTCACGSLTVSGGTFRPYRQWTVTNGAGWTDLSDEDEDTAAGTDDGADGDQP